MSGQPKSDTRCVVCGCTNSTPCIGGPMGTCWFTHVDEVSNAGLCSQCAARPLEDLERLVQFTFVGEV